MGLKKCVKRRKRRQARNAKGRPRHNRIAGRTGSIRAKQRHGMLIELSRRRVSRNESIKPT